MQEQNFPNFQAKLNYLETYLLSCENYSDEQLKNLKHQFSPVKFEFKQRWEEAEKKEKRFLQNIEEWLQKM